MNINRLADAGVQIRQRRKALQMRQTDLASRTGLSSRSLSSIENGGDMQLSTLIKICAALNMNIELSDESSDTGSSEIW